jgi:hypothetical protein
MRVALLVVGCLLAIVSCAGDRHVGTEDRSVRDSAGVEIVTIHGSVPRDPTMALDPIPITTIGRDSADVNQQFRGIPLAVRLSTGHVVVTEEGRLSSFDSTGAFVRTLARRGSGPGELQGVSRMIVIPGDTLVVRGGAGILRYAFGSGGALVSEERLACATARSFREGSVYCARDFFADGSAVTVAPDSTIPITATNRPDRHIGNGFTSPGPGLLRQLYRVYFIPPGRDTVHRTGLSSGIEQYGIEYAPGRDVFVVHPFYTRRSFFASNGDPRRIAIALNPAHEIEIWSDRGRLIRLIRRMNGRRAPTAIERDSARGVVAMYLEDSPVTVDRALAEMPVPDSLPAIAGLVVGPAGEVVVQTSGWHIADTTSLVDVFDDRGVWVAQWTLPGRTRLLELGRDYLLTGRVDENDIPVIEVWRVDRRDGSDGGIVGRL